MIEEKLTTNSPEEPEPSESAPAEEVKAEEAKEVVEQPKGKKKRKKSKVQSIIEWVVTGFFGVLFVIAGIGQIDGMVNSKKHFGQPLRLGFGSFIVYTDSMIEYPKNSAIITYLEDSDTIYNRWLKIKDDENKHIDVTFWGTNSGMYSYVVPSDVLPELTTPSYPETAYPVTHRIRHIYLNEGKAKGEGKYTFITTGTNTGGELSKESQFQAFSEKELLGTVKIGSKALGWGFRVISSPIGLLIFLLIPALYLIITSSIDILKALKTSEEESKTKVIDNDTKKLSSLDSLSEADRKRLKEEMLEQMMKGKDDDK